MIYHIYLSARKIIEILIITGKIIKTLYKNPVYYIEAYDDKISHERS